MCDLKDKNSKKSSKVIVGVISRGKDNGKMVQSVITSFSDTKNSQWLQNLIHIFFIV